MRIATILLSVVAIAVTFGCLAKQIMKKDNNIYNYIELKATYKNYIIVDKNNKDYSITLLNPLTEKEKTIKINEALYYNKYFVTDTIK